jgi:hypothetical protein
MAYNRGLRLTTTAQTIQQLWFNLCPALSNKWWLGVWEEFACNGVAVLLFNRKGL